MKQCLKKVFLNEFDDTDSFTLECKTKGLKVDL